jgi:hypothetical protein
MKTRMSIAQFNAAIQAEGIPCELVKGRGYLYVTTIAPLDYESESIMVYAYNQLTPTEWRERVLAIWNEWKHYVTAA